MVLDSLHNMVQGTWNTGQHFTLSNSAYLMLASIAQCSVHRENEKQKELHKDMRAR